MESTIIGWRGEAACRGMDASVFFPETGGNETAQVAKAICAQCTVRNDCLEAGLHDKFGIWGGTTEAERRRLRRRLREGYSLASAS